MYFINCPPWLLNGEKDTGVTARIKVIKRLTRRRINHRSAQIIVTDGHGRPIMNRGYSNLSVLSVNQSV